MISDTLSDAIDEIRKYRENMPEAYGHQDVAKALDDVTAHMDAIRAILDTPTSQMSAWKDPWPLAGKPFLPSALRQNG